MRNFLWCRLKCGFKARKRLVMNADWQLKFNLQTEIKTDPDWSSDCDCDWSYGCGWDWVWVWGRSDKPQGKKINRSILCSSKKNIAYFAGQKTLSVCLLFYAGHSNCRAVDDWLMISLASFLFHFKTRIGWNTNRNSGRILHTSLSAFSFSVGIMANQSFSSSTAHCASTFKSIINLRTTWIKSTWLSENYASE